MKSILRVTVVGLCSALAAVAAVVAPYRAVTHDVDNLWMLSWLGFLVVGGFLVAKRPDNRVSWTVAGIGLLPLAGAISEAWAPRPGEGMGLLLALMTNLTVAGFVLIPLFLLWYPTGRVPSPGWLWLERVSLALGGVLVVYYFVRPGLLGVSQFSNPFGLDFLAPLRDSAVEQGAGELATMLGVLALFSLVMRWRRAGGLERRQIKLVAVAGLLFVVLVGLIFVLEGVIGEDNGVVDVIEAIAFVLGLNAIAVAIAVAIVRYRLYEIDRIISRTVSYAIVVVVLALVYLAGVTALTAVLPGDSPLAVAGSTLAIAALFNPLRRRIQGWVDRRFNRSRYDAERVMGGFADSLRDRVDPKAVVEGWIGVVSESMQPTTVGVWVRKP